MAPDFPEHVINQPLKSNEEPLRAECFKMLFEDIDLFFSEGLKHVACMNDTGIAGGSSTSTLKEFGGKTSVGSEDMPFLQQVRGNVAIFDFANSRKLVYILNDEVSLTPFLLGFYSLQVRKRTKLIFLPQIFASKLIKGVKGKDDNLVNES